MSFSFLPDIIIDKVTDLAPETLQSRGIGLLLLDFDNTLLPYTNSVPGEELLYWISTLQSAGITLCVVSNSRKSRVPDFCRAYGIECVTRAKKPSPVGIHKALRQFNVENNKAALVGDQIYTDVLAANRAGVVSILCKPIHLNNIFLKLRHAAEKPFIFLGKRRTKGDNNT